MTNRPKKRRRKKKKKKDRPEGRRATLGSMFETEDLEPEDVGMEGPESEMSEMELLQFHTRKEFHPWKKLMNQNFKHKMVRQALESEDEDEEDESDFLVTPD